MKQLSVPGSLARSRSSSTNKSDTGLLQNSGLDVPSVVRFEGMPALLEPPTTLDDIDLKQNLIADILLRLTYNEGEVSVSRAEEIMKLPYRVLDELLQWLQQEHIIEVAKAVGSLGRRGYVYSLTEEGQRRAKEALARTLYVGPAPVPIEKYYQS
ncbi:MAG TPA: hypothetical protein PKD98_14840, partial [Anaerolineae bacterium]|nr:hypothetical protein [Anaerolineae bacterium]